MSNYPHVFTPLEIRGVLFKNRLEQAPPGALNGADEQGFCTDKLVRSFKQFARGGIAIYTIDFFCDGNMIGSYPFQLRK